MEKCLALVKKCNKCKHRFKKGEKVCPKCKAKRPKCQKAPVAGNKRCRLHGGVAGRPIITGKYSKRLRGEVKELVQEQETSNISDFKSLSEEVGVLRALLNVVLQKLDNIKKLDTKDLHDILDVIDTLGKTLDRHFKIIEGHRITIDVLGVRAIINQQINVVAINIETLESKILSIFPEKKGEVLDIFRSQKKKLIQDVERIQVAESSPGSK